jgi:hypothetical protein
MHRVVAVLVVLTGVVALAASAGARVLRVGTYHGVHGQFSSVQAAVRAAKPGDWILVGPGDYKTKPSSISTPKGGAEFPAGVVISKAGLHLRGMNRNKVIIDGTRPGSAVCSNRASAQNYGLKGPGPSAGGSASRYAGGKASRYAPNAATGDASGANGIEVYKASNVSVQNLTVCNFLSGSRDAGNEIWWNGGDNTSKVFSGHGYNGDFLTATSTFFKGEKTAAAYGIFSVNWSGGTWDHIYASNFNDSGFYIGACQQVCNQTVDHAHAQYNALGYSGSNSGGKLIVEHSEFDHNQGGFDTNSQNGDNPPPQDGACPHNGISPITHTHSCWVFMHNFVHDNNNPNVPSSGGAAAEPVGTGVSVSGGRNDTVMDNRFVNNDAWGTIFVNFPDSGGPCNGGTVNSVFLGNGSCLFDEWGDALIDNTYSHNGGYGNPTNGDFEQLNFESHPSDCFKGNVDTSGALTPVSAALEQAYPTCTTTAVAPNLNLAFVNQVVCDSSLDVPPFGCQPGDHYPTGTHVVMHPLRPQQTMSNPCKGVPANPWCRRKA